jgi:dTDP-4-amino-4,6-dideoxygalactose transaminase
MKRFNIPFSPPDMTEAEVNEVREAVLSGWITTGPRTKELERQIADYVGVARAVCLNSATACLEMALRLLGIGEGDEVIVPSNTYIATVLAVTYVGAQIVFVEPDINTFNINPSLIEAAITSRC